MSTIKGASASAGPKPDQRTSRSPTILEEEDGLVRIATHPGEILQEEFLAPLKITVPSLARELGVPHDRIIEIIRGERPVTADTAIRLGIHFRTSSQFWLNLQQAYDLTTAEETGDFANVSTRREDA